MDSWHATDMTFSPGQVTDGRNIPKKTRGHLRFSHCWFSRLRYLLLYIEGGQNGSNANECAVDCKVPSWAYSAEYDVGSMNGTLQVGHITPPPSKAKRRDLRVLNQWIDRAIFMEITFGFEFHGIRIRAFIVEYRPVTNSFGERVLL